MKQTVAFKSQWQALRQRNLTADAIKSAVLHFQPAETFTKTEDEHRHSFFCTGKQRHVCDKRVTCVRINYVECVLFFWDKSVDEHNECVYATFFLDLEACGKSLLITSLIYWLFWKVNIRKRPYKTQVEAVSMSSHTNKSYRSIDKILLLRTPRPGNLGKHMLKSVLQSHITWLLSTQRSGSGRSLQTPPIKRGKQMMMQ